MKLENGTQKTIKLREQYTLEKVSAGIATIRVTTQPLTPVDDASVEAQLMQQMSQGVIKFDIDHGRLISKELTWMTKSLASAEQKHRFSTMRALPKNQSTANPSRLKCQPQPQRVSVRT